MTAHKYIDIREFVQVGYLQEVNRLFLHPLGLALSVRIDGEKWELDGIWDYREDPEGIIFDEGDLGTAEKAARVQEAWEAHEAARRGLLSDHVVQKDSNGARPPCCAYHCHRQAAVDALE